MIPTCAVTCTMYDQNGSPEEGAVVRAKLNRYEIYEGYVVPEMVTGICDQFGQCVLNLWPNELGATASLYEITLVGEKGRKLQTQAAVPHVPAADLHSIALIPPYPGKSDGQISLEEAHKSATEAKAAAEAAKKSEENAKVSEDNAKISEDNAKVSEDNAKVSEDNAKASEIAAKASEDAAGDSEENAAKSQEWAEKAEISAGEAAVSAAEASDSADEAFISANEANQSALDAQIAEDSAITAANNSEAAMIKAEEARDASEDWRDESEWFANNAIWSGPEAPVNPKQLWYRTSGAGAGSTYFYFKDGNSDQWVPMSPAGGGGSPSPTAIVNKDYVVKLNNETRDYADSQPIPKMVLWKCCKYKTKTTLKTNEFMLNETGDAQMEVYMSALSDGRYWAASSSTGYSHSVGDHMCTITNQYGSCMRQFKGRTWWFMQGSGNITSGAGFYNSIQGDSVKNGSNEYEDFVDGEYYNLNFGSPFPLYTYPSAMRKDGNPFKY